MAQLPDEDIRAAGRLRALRAQRAFMADQHAEAEGELDTVRVRVQEVAAQREAIYAALNACILSEQMPQEAVPMLVASIPGFQEWRVSRRSGAVE